MTKRLFSSLILAGIVACYVMAQPPRPEPRETSGHQLILDLFDINHDGQLSATEIDEASSALINLDRNGDGTLTGDELPRPKRPPQGNAQGSPRPRRDAHGSTDTRSVLHAERGAVMFEGGYATDPRDGGRPVALIAAALNVTSDVFREAFSGVTPARGGHPTSSQVRSNKKVLLDALTKFGVTNERLDEVSDYYRYQPQSGELWQHRPAKAVAVIEHDKVVSVTLLDAGAGYLSSPHVTIAGFPEVRVDTEIEFTGDLKTNGRIRVVKVLPQ
jgi:hypothetical protein